MFRSCLNQIASFFSLGVVQPRIADVASGVYFLDFSVVVDHVYFIMTMPDEVLMSAVLCIPAMAYVSIVRTLSPSLSLSLYECQRHCFSMRSHKHGCLSEGSLHPCDLYHDSLPHTIQHYLTYTAQHAERTKRLDFLAQRDSPSTSSW